ncbi:hypothetical protein CBM2633_A40372 [Cupriavidus taiwanensis]|nr:hypothetical protein CBM2604_A50120 [Cupriavidus taiwanensis]SOZ27524.1 hypothetical protein CBM2609_A60121 [Cupriavidus taiwanensis]SOZ45851.1 hypothetical protein CBM2610_A70119 [Cupriavidus taiwanensis]SPA13614.1 hypothetical protein CBM2633_A40372 [Cupriavidus taiwanensis]
MHYGHSAERRQHDGQAQAAARPEARAAARAESGAEKGVHARARGTDAGQHGGRRTTWHAMLPEIWKNTYPYLP